MNRKGMAKKIVIALLSAIMVATPELAFAASPDKNTNPYDEWKIEAVNYPENGKLVPAGPIEIEWDTLTVDNKDVTNYEVYLDGIQQTVDIIKTENGYSCEVYTTKVAKHQVKILAILNDGTKISTSIRNFYVSKKGLGFHTSDGRSAIEGAQNMGLSWYYNWGTAPTYNGTCPNGDLSKELDYVPMIWGAYNGSNEKITEIKNAKYKTVLGYNEPDFKEQSNVSVETALANQKYFTESGLRVGAPATAIGSANSDWFKEYWSKVNHDDIDFIPIHNYPGNVGVTDAEIKSNAKNFIKLVTDTHEMTNKPIWITEFAVANWDQYWGGYNGANDENKPEVRKFMNYVINGFDDIVGLNDLEFVERYAWFSFNALDFYGGDSSLFNSKDDNKLNSSLKVGSLTTLGKQYRDLGNPDDYILADLDGTKNNISEDVYVDDYVEVTIDGKTKRVKLGGNLVGLETPIKEGYVFKGWYSDDRFTTKYNLVDTITKNTTLYAKWVKLLTVTIGDETTIVESGNMMTEPDKPTKEGYTFGGWYSDVNCTKEFDFTKAITEDTVIYIKWEINATEYIDVTIDGVVNQLVKGEKLVQPNQPIKDGYVFKGWYRDQKYTQEFDFDVPIYQDVIIYTKWNKLCKVNIDGVESSVEEGEKITVPKTPTKEGYVFKGWYRDEKYNNEFDFDIPVTDDVNVYAKWVKNNNVDQETNNGSGVIKEQNGVVVTGDVCQVQNYILGMIGTLGLLLLLKKKY